MKLFSNMEETINHLETLINNDPRMLTFNKEIVLNSLEIFHDGLEIQSNFWFVIQNYMLHRSDKDPEAKELLMIMKRMGIE